MKKIKYVQKEEKMVKIRVLIVDDNRIINDFIKQYLSQFEDIEVVGCCYTDEEEVSMINSLNPDIVITDLVRNGKLSGIEIIRSYKSKGGKAKFIVITAGTDEDLDYRIIDGIIKKPFYDYKLIYNEIKKIM